MRMKGYRRVNVLLVAGGSIFGLLVSKKHHRKKKNAVFTVLGMVTAFAGFKINPSDHSVDESRRLLGKRLPASEPFS
jgi:uncharacterized membrane protein YqgA involved in biofilm formation